MCAPASITTKLFSFLALIRFSLDCYDRWSDQSLCLTSAGTGGCISVAIIHALHHFLILLVAFLASLLSVYHIPLPWPDASPQWPWLYLVGLWVAIVFAVGFIGIYIGLLTNQARHILCGLSDARFNMAREQQVVSLGSLATVAAHKLGSPLNTITLITHELEMLDEKVDYDTLANEITALKVKTERCRMILAGLSEDANQIDQMSHDPVSVLALIQAGR